MNNLDNFNQIPGDMERVKCILCHPEFQKSMEEIRICEADRIFCCHGIEHLLDVARIAWIDNLERGLGYKKDVVYSAGLLHDVGKYLQYKKKIPHHITSEKIGRQILSETGYTADEIDDICSAVLTHRDKMEAEKSVLGTMIYRADKISRACYVCPAAGACSWSDEKKTPGVIS